MKKAKERITGWLRREAEATAALLRCIPATVVTLFVVSVICMNLLANKTLVQTRWIALDGGILVSWLSFMCMDVITRYFGPGASNRIALLACGINLLTCLIFYIASIIPSNAADYTALNGILGGTWFILLGSTVAFLFSACLNNGLHYSVQLLFRKNPDGRLAYAASAYISTFIGQFMDNFLFSLIVFVWFAPIYWDGFRWTVTQCAACALTGALAELAMEAVFTPIGYRLVKRWQRQGVGQEYLKLMEDRKGQ